LDPREWRINRVKVMGGYFQVVSLERLRPETVEAAAVAHIAPA